MTSKEAVLELICEAKSVNIDEEQVKSIERWPVWGFTVSDNVEYAFRDRGKT